MAEDCYFWIDQSIPYEDRKMNPVCIKCREEKRPDIDWFWRGSKLGYGPFDFICCFCGHEISIVKEKDEIKD